MNNLEYLKLEENKELIVLFLYFNSREITSMKKIRAFLDSEVECREFFSSEYYQKKEE